VGFLTAALRFAAAAFGAGYAGLVASSYMAATIYPSNFCETRYSAQKKIKGLNLGREHGGEVLDIICALTNSA
jgi:hypothetical protein